MRKLLSGRKMSLYDPTTSASSGWKPPPQPPSAAPDRSVKKLVLYVLSGIGCICLIGGAIAIVLIISVAKESGKENEKSPAVSLPSKLGKIFEEEIDFDFIDDKEKQLYTGYLLLIQMGQADQYNLIHGLCGNAIQEPCLHLALSAFQYKTAKLLIENGADVNDPSGYPLLISDPLKPGWTPLQCVQNHYKLTGDPKCEKMIRLLKRHGAKDAPTPTAENDAAGSFSGPIGFRPYSNPSDIHSKSKDDKEGKEPAISPPQPAPSPATRPEDEIREALYHYALTEQLMDLDAHMACYADQINWYNKVMPREELRGLFAPVFADSSSMDMRIDDINIAFHGANAASVEMNKYFRFIKPGKDDFCGEVRALHELEKINGQWLTVGVKELDVKWKETIDCTDYTRWSH